MASVAHRIFLGMQDEYSWRSGPVAIGDSHPYAAIPHASSFIERTDPAVDYLAMLTIAAITLQL